MIQTINNISVTGKLVKVALEKKEGQNGEYIGGSLILRTIDGSEHEINYYANRYKKDKDGNLTSEESSLYKGLETVINEYKSLETNPEDADIVKVGACEFGIQDYVSKQDQLLKSFNDIKAKFANRLTSQEVETTPQVATFEVQGIITKIDNELKKEQPTGNLEIHIDAIGYGGTIIPVKLIVPEAMVEPFSKAGFYESGVAKFSGKIINTKTTETITEQQAFGEPIVKTVTTTVRRYEITGGTPQGTVYDIKLTDEEYETAKSKRRLKLTEIKNKANNQTQQIGFTASQSTTNNPFTPTGDNPFAPRQ